MKALILNCSPVRDGATAEICGIAANALQERFAVTASCIDDFSFSFCKGCRTCHETAKCVLHDDVEKLMCLFAENDVLLLVAPSYWGDVPGQFKAFIDRCTPWSNTHDPHAVLPAGKKGYCITLRTGDGEKEAIHLCDTIAHFFSHLNIEAAGRLPLTSVAYREDVEEKKNQIESFCKTI